MKRCFVGFVFLLISASSIFAESRRSNVSTANSIQHNACPSDGVVTDDNGFRKAVIAGSDQIEAFTDTSMEHVAFKMELLRPYYVVCEGDQFLKITDVSMTSDAGRKPNQAEYVDIEQVFDWTSRGTLDFAEFVFSEERVNLVSKMLADAEETTKIKKRVLVFKENWTVLRKNGDKIDLPSILLSVLKADKMENLHRLGVDYNIDLNKGGVLLHRAFIVENDDLLTPEVLIDKQTLVNLIDLISNITGGAISEKVWAENVSKSVTTFSGEEHDVNETFKNLVERKLGVKLSSNLLNWNLNYSLLVAERLELNKRLQKVVFGLTKFLDENQDAFDGKNTVWMPIAILP